MAVNAGPNEIQRIGIHRDRNGQSDLPRVFAYIFCFMGLGFLLFCWVVFANCTCSKGKTL